MFVKCVYLIHLTDPDHVSCPYVQKVDKLFFFFFFLFINGANLSVSHTSGSFHAVLNAVLLQEKCRGGGLAVAGGLTNFTWTSVARKGPYIHLNVTFRTKTNVIKARGRLSHLSFLLKQTTTYFNISGESKFSPNAIHC